MRFFFILYLHFDQYCPVRSSVEQQAGQPRLYKRSMVVVDVSQIVQLGGLLRQAWFVVAGCILDVFLLRYHPMLTFIYRSSVPLWSGEAPGRVPQGPQGKLTEAERDTNLLVSRTRFSRAPPCTLSGYPCPEGES